jgi:hypothetical protein
MGGHGACITVRNHIEEKVEKAGAKTIQGSETFRKKLRLSLKGL